VYASIDKADPDHVVMVAINKSLAPVTATIHLDGAAGYGAAKVWTLTSAAATPQAASGITATGSDVFTYTMPAQSVSTIVPSLAPAAPPRAPRHSEGAPMSGAPTAATSKPTGILR
jgi:O-glycosyl hydrolase